MPDLRTGVGAARSLPIASWVAARGRCRHCGAAVSAFYPAIELAALGIALWAAAVIDDMALLWASCGLGWCLLALAAIDLRVGLLPDVLTLSLTAAGFGITALTDSPMLPWHLLGATLGYFLFAGVNVLYRRLRGRDGIGGGDAKLLAAAGAWLSWQGLPSVVLIAAVAGLAAALTLRLTGRALAADTRIAFGPGLCLGLWLVWMYGPLAPGR